MEETDPRHLLVGIAKILRQLKIPYLVTGGIAVLVWGRPRFTADIDIVVELKENVLTGLGKALKNLSKAGYLDRETMVSALKGQGEFNFIDAETGVKVDFWMLKKEEFDQSRLKRRVPRELLGEQIYFTSPEDLILIKLRWYKASGSSRQLEDVESILKISGKVLDLQYLTLWARKLNVQSILERLI